MGKASADFERLAEEFEALKKLLAKSERYLAAEISKRLSVISRELAGIADTLNTRDVRIE